MKIAYLCSLYPAMSHTFIVNEVQALRERGLEITTFSVRQARGHHILGPVAEAEARRTRWLVPGNPWRYFQAVAWAKFRNLPRFLRVWFDVMCRRYPSLRERFLWLMYFLEACQLARWLVREECEHLHCHFGNNGSNTAWLAARLTGLPFSMTLHGIDLDEPMRFRLPEKIADSKFTVCISDYGRSKMQAVCDQKHWSKLHVIHCGVTVPEYVPRPPQTGQVLCVARLSEEKGHAVLLNAFAALQRRGVHFRCVLIGDGPLRSVLETQAAELDLSPHVDFLGALPPAEVARHYELCDAVVLASYGEGIPLVLMEAFAHARPVVATAVGGIPELVADTENGLLVPPGDAVRLAQALEKLLSDADRARAMGDAGQKRIREQFRHDVAAEKLARLFLE